MTFSFDPTLSNDISKVRQRLGDTEADNPLIPDETIEAYLATLSVLKTAARLARDLSAKYARLVSSKGDQQETTASDLYKHYKDLAITLEREAAAEQPPTNANFSGISLDGATRGYADRALSWFDDAHSMPGGVDLWPC